MTRTSAPTNAQVVAFAAAVREALSDLPSDAIDELVDGLEADLSEQAADSAADFQFGDPDDYAAELRSAAGLPDRAHLKGAGRQGVQDYLRRLDELDRRVWQRIRTDRFGGWLIDTLIALRPVWWVARGWVLYIMLAPLIGADSNTFFLPGSNLGEWMLLTALVLLSVQWGRGRWARTKFLQVARTIVSIVTAIALPFLLVAAANSVQQAIDYAYIVENTVPPGMAVDGERVRNIYAYDAGGNPIDAVQLFDQNGNPLTTVGTCQSPDSRFDECLFGGEESVPVALEEGRQNIWNVFPLQEAPADVAWEMTPDPDTARTPAFPFVVVPPLDGAKEPIPTPTPTP